ncbi:MAG: hypothetical protein SGI71_10440 [Verrucomicrobiota bacterium]|nr:hypothetical protein [Verrucomicrobiota bacterium]
MSKVKNTSYILILIITLVCMVYGLWRLLKVRIDTGDVFPPYSTLRADPLGSKAYYISLSNLESLKTFRNTGPLDRLKLDNDTTLVFTGVQAEDFAYSFEYDPPFRLFLESFITKGGRLVVTFFPHTTKPESARYDSKTNDTQLSKETLNSREKQNKWRRLVSEKNRKAGKAPELYLPVQNRWGIDWDFLKDRPDIFERTHFAETEDRSDRVPWATVLHFASLTPEWTTLYSFEGNPVIVERTLGKGTILFCADSFYLSNEALVKKHKPRLLSTLPGSHRMIIFDETHHGVEEKSGMGTLLRRYHLFGPIIAALILALLFIWKNSISLVRAPRTTQSSGPAIIKGKGNTDGLANILRRTVNPRELPLLALNRLRLNRNSSRSSEAQMADAEVIAQEEKEKLLHKADPISAWNRITRLLNTRKKI